MTIKTKNYAQRSANNCFGCTLCYNVHSVQYCEVRCASLIDLDTIVSYYIHAKVNIFSSKLRYVDWLSKVYSAKNLLTFCEGFLLQNLVALLTYDDSVKRLIFGKKLQNHDVISGLLKTLQVIKYIVVLYDSCIVCFSFQERARKRGPKSKKHSL